jgi:hypothetical protein
MPSPTKERPTKEQIEEALGYGEKPWIGCLGTATIYCITLAAAYRAQLAECEMLKKHYEEAKTMWEDWRDEKTDIYSVYKTYERHKKEREEGV